MSEETRKVAIICFTIGIILSLVIVAVSSHSLEALHSTEAVVKAAIAANKPAMEARCAMEDFPPKHLECWRYVGGSK